jgi:copper(I)-binding protein
MAAAMLVIHNSGPADRLVSVTAPGFGDVSLHATRTTPDGGERMVAVGRPLTVPANGTLSLQPDGYHVMLMQPAEPLRRGGAVSMTLTFARAGALHLTVPVVAMTGLPGMGESN